jgi:hypothetical protein
MVYQGIIESHQGNSEHLSSHEWCPVYWGEPFSAILTVASSIAHVLWVIPVYRVGISILRDPAESKADHRNCLLHHENTHNLSIEKSGGELELPIHSDTRSGSILGRRESASAILFDFPERW